jgi:hypothetical protein
MTPRIPPLLLIAGALAGCAGTAASHVRSVRTEAPRVAILAADDASPAVLQRLAANARLRAAGGPATLTVRRVGGLFEAQAQSAALAAEGYDTVIGVGAVARAAVGQAASAEVGDGTRWSASAAR